MKNVGGHAMDALFVLGVVCAMAAGVVTGMICTWGFILVCSVVLGIVWLITCIGSALGSGSNSGFWTAFLFAGIPLFLICSWCSFWISLAGVLRR